MAGQKPVERIEAFRIRTLGGFGAQMPFSDTARTVVIPFQQSRKQFFIVRKAISRLIQVTFISVALSVAARQHHGSRRAAHRRRHMSIRKDTPFGCQAVDVRCLDIRSVIRTDVCSQVGNYRAPLHRSESERLRTTPSIAESTGV